MSRSAAPLPGDRVSYAARSRRGALAVIAGALVLSVLGRADLAAQGIDRYSCIKGSSQRIIELRYSSAGKLPCEVWYGTTGALHRQAESKNAPGFCDAVVRNIHANLVKGGHTCNESAAREPPGGSVDASPLTREDEIAQASKVELQRCLPLLRQVTDECERYPFKSRVVGQANTPMTIGGADIPVLLVQVRYDPKDMSERTGGHYLVSKEQPATIRAIDEAYEEFQSMWSADLNDDGRTELMIFTNTRPRQGRATTSFAVIGDSRMLGYVSVSDAPVQVHEVHTAKTRTGGYWDLIALIGDAVFECQYRSGYQCRKLMLLDAQGRP